MSAGSQPRVQCCGGEQEMHERRRTVPHIAAQARRSAAEVPAAVYWRRGKGPLGSVEESSAVGAQQLAYPGGEGCETMVY